MDTLLEKIRRFLRESPHVHVKQEEITTVKELVELIDRFIRDGTHYPLEWDDFISWENSNPQIEEIRDEIADLEPLYFSKDGAMKSEAALQLRRIRDRVAASAGIATMYNV